MTSSYIHYQLNGFYTLAHKETTRILRIWKMTIAPPLLTTYLFCLVFGTVLGSRLGLFAGVDYLSFILPGLLMNVVVLESFNNCASTLMIDKFHKVTDTLVTSPMHESVLILAYLTGSLVRVAVVSTCLIILLYAISDLHIVRPLLLLYSLLVSICLFSFLGLLSGLYANRFDELSTIPTFIITPLTFFSGVFYDVNRLPYPWLTISQYNPLFYLIKLFRRSFISSYQVDITTYAIGMGVASLALFGILVLLFRRGWGIKV